MDLQANSAQSRAKWALAHTGALALFLLTGILLVASLNTEGGQRTVAGTSAGILAGPQTIASERK